MKVSSYLVVVLSRKYSKFQILSQFVFFFILFLVARNNLFFILVGFSVGTAGGIMIGMWMARPHFTSPVMKAIVCFSFKDDVRID